METRLQTGSCFYSARSSPELHLIVPDLITGTLWAIILYILWPNHVKSSINLRLTFVTQTQYLKLSFRKVCTKGRLSHFVVVQQYAAPKSSVQKSNIVFFFFKNTVNKLSKYCAIKFHSLLKLLDGFSHVHFHGARLLILAIMAVR